MNEIIKGDLIKVKGLIGLFEILYVCKNLSSNATEVIFYPYGGVGENAAVTSMGEVTKVNNPTYIDKIFTKEKGTSISDNIRNSETKTVVEHGWKKGNNYSFYIVRGELFNVLEMIKELHKENKDYEVEISLVDRTDKVHINVQEHKYVTNDFSSLHYNSYGSKVNSFGVPTEDRGV